MNSNDTIPSLIFDGERLSHAYIVSGGLTETLAMAVVCSGPGSERPCAACTHCDKASRRIHPDITFIDKPPDKREIIVDQIRGLKKDVVIVPNESERKAYIINNADLMNKNAQNAFLQILEEPPAHAVFILKTENPAALLPTVRSRCVETKFKTASVSEACPPCPTAASDMASDFFTALEHGNASLMELMFRLEKLDKETFDEFLEAARERAAFLIRSDISVAGLNGRACDSAYWERLTYAEALCVRAGEMLDLNVSTGHISGMICANLLRIEN